MPTCSFCQDIFGARDERKHEIDVRDSRKSQKIDVGYYSREHQPSLRHLIDSGKTCSMCRYLIAFFSPTTIEEALSRPYSKLHILSSSRRGDNELKEEAAIKLVELNTNNRVWRSEEFAVVTNKSKSAG
jgi:hypothetical protein